MSLMCGIVLIANRDLKQGEECFFDYEWAMAEAKPEIDHDKFN